MTSPYSPLLLKDNGATHHERNRSDVCATSIAESTSCSHAPTTTAHNIPPNQSPPPPCAPQGGQWGKTNYIGGKTAGATFLAVLCFWPAIFLLCCPFDEKDAYMAPNGDVYDASGYRIGGRYTSFVPSR